MLLLGTEILQEAYTWERTPWRKSMCVKGRGVDCLNFIGGVFKNLGILTHVPTREYNYRFWENPNSDLLQEGIDEGIEYLAPGYSVVSRPILDPGELLAGDMITLMCIQNDERATHAAFFDQLVANQVIVVDSRHGRHGGVRRQPSAHTWRMKDYYRIARPIS